MPDPREHIGPNTFLKYHAVQYYIVLGAISQWWRITSKLNNSRIQIRIQIFTKIESICPCHTHITQLERHLIECIPPPCNAWSTRTYRAQYIFEISCDTVLYRFWPYLSTVKNHFKKWNNSRIQILVSGFRFRSSPKSNQFIVDTHPTCPPSFVRIRPTTFWDIVFGPIS